MQSSITKTKKVNKITKELKKRRTLIRKQNESDKERKQNERRQKRENRTDEDIDIGRFFELATSDKIYFNKLKIKIQEIKCEI